MKHNGMTLPSPPTAALFFIAEEKGFFKEEGLNYEAVTIDTTTDTEMKDEFCCMVAASGAADKAHTEELAKLTRAIQKASKFVADNPEETARLIAEKNMFLGTRKSTRNCLEATITELL
ncbi:MAG: hypothetical protein LBD29_04595 [Treponema sp.]|jgi:ABC-type nitrate/sulfonate/bicarbonate transport system substrate-binding protein|nr:hypothetical protein [Treponema sp.]